MAQCISNSLSDLQTLTTAVWRNWRDSQRTSLQKFNRVHQKLKNITLTDEEILISFDVLIFFLAYPQLVQYLFWRMFYKIWPSIMTSSSWRIIAFSWSEYIWIRIVVNSMAVFQTLLCDVFQTEWKDLHG